MIKNKRYTTVNTDAGIKRMSCGKLIAAYAYWIRSENHVIRHSNVFKSLIINTNEAEVAAVLNALLCVLNDDYLKSADVIVVNCDSKHALNMLENNCFPPKYTQYESKYNYILTKLNKTVKFKYVKGHSGATDNRSFVNNWCDKAIRKHYK